MIRTNARQQGGAVVLTIPADVLRLRGIKAGDPLGIDVTPDGFNVRKAGVPETSAADPGPVVCEPLGIHFPTLYRGVATTTLEDLQASGIADDPEATLGQWVLYNLDKSATVIGTVSWGPVNHIYRDDQDESFAIRHHPNIESAMGYIDATLDFTHSKESGDSTAGQMLFQTEDGIFTFAPIPTSPSWPGPLVLYLANVPSARWENHQDDWAHVVGPDGEIVELPEFMVPKPSTKGER